jgi:GNAT superfamily N-acetyltransferase
LAQNNFDKKRRLRPTAPRSDDPEIMTAVPDSLPFRIRFAQTQDIPTVLSLIHALAEYERAPDEVIATEALLKENLFGAQPAAEVLLAEENGAPVGFALFFHNFSTWMGRRGLYLEDLFVMPEKRGRGYGRALLVRLAQIARDRECGRMEWAVLDWNEPALNFYETLGARQMNEWVIHRLTPPEIEKLSAES